MAGVGLSIGPLCLIMMMATTSMAAVLPPRLSTTVNQVSVSLGQKEVVLECNLDVGDDPISYRWLKNHVIVTGAVGFGYRGYRQVLLALHDIQPQHRGTYVCEASNEAGVHTASITVTVDMTGGQPVVGSETTHTDDILSDIATSMSDVLAEGDCRCDTLFLLHVSIDAPQPQEILAAQANLAHTIADSFISPNTRVSVMSYSDYINTQLTFSAGVDRCALRGAFKNITHKQWPTRIQPVLRDVFKKFRKSKKECKVLFLPVFESLGTEGVDTINANLLKKLGVKIFVLEVTDTPLPNVSDMASQRGDGFPYHWRVPLNIWPTIVINMKYISEELVSCPAAGDVPGQCVGLDEACTEDSQCRGAGYGCIEGRCQLLQCNINPRTPGCCKDSDQEGSYWCGDVTNQCTASGTICDGRVQCMNGADESRCWSNPCPEDKVARCQTSTLCLGLNDLCNGEPECPGGEDEDPRFCRPFPCPRDRPFRCTSGKCIANDGLCDGVFKDCSEGEDEDLNFCKRVHVCPPSRPFKCDYGICIPNRMVCDGSLNCLDASDELVCGKKNCPAERPFKCLRSGLCIGMAKVCNGDLDGCEDGSDEHNCTTIPCPVDRPYKCQSGKCIRNWLKCDGNDDCGDGSDEIGCGGASPEEPACGRDEFKCQSGACISQDRVCDGRRTCLDGDDELDCSVRPCPPNRPYRCRDGLCVVSVTPCDGFNDCNDGSDESNCTHPDHDDYIEEDYEYDYNENDDNNYEDDELPEPSVLPPPSRIPVTTTPRPMIPVEEETMGEDTDEHATHVENPAEDEDIVLDDPPSDDDNGGDIDDFETVLEEPEPEPKPEPADVQTAASSEQGASGGTCTAPLCAPLVLVPLLALNVRNAWMR